MDWLHFMLFSPMYVESDSTGLNEALPSENEVYVVKVAELPVVIMMIYWHCCCSFNCTAL